MGLLNRVNDLIKSCYGQNRPKMVITDEKGKLYDHLMVTWTEKPSAGESDYITLPSCTLGKVGSRPFTDLGPVRRPVHDNEGIVQNGFFGPELGKILFPSLFRKIQHTESLEENSQRIDTNDGYLEMRLPLEIKNEMIEHLTSNFMVRQQSRMIESLLRSKKFNEIKNGNNQLK